MIMKSADLIMGAKDYQTSLKMRHILCAAVIFISTLTLNACGGNDKTGAGTDKTSTSTGSTSSESGTAYTPEQSSAYSKILAPYLRKNHPNIYFSKSGGSLSVREGAVWVTLPFAGKDTALETCNAVAAFATSSEAPFAVPNVMVEAGPEPGSGSSKASITAKGAAGGTCTVQ
jgi:hypothetical protein